MGIDLAGTDLLYANPAPGLLTDVERLHDIEQKLRCWAYLSDYPDAERDVAGLPDWLADRDARIAEFFCL